MHLGSSIYSRAPVSIDSVNEFSVTRRLPWLENKIRKLKK
jgi:hypothetical protein